MYFDEAPKCSRHDFYNFDRELKLLMDSIRQGTRLIVVKGLRRTGKTSLVLTALSELHYPYLLLDARLFSAAPTVPRAELLRALERGLNEFLLREKFGKRILNLFRGVRGIEVEFPPPRVRIAWEPRHGTDPLDVITRLTELAQQRQRRLILVLDEAQELRRIAGYNFVSLMAHLYDYVRGVQLVVTGSQVGVLDDFMGAEDPASPLFGRMRVEIEMRHLSNEEAKEFLTIGGRQAGLEMKREVVEYAVKKLDGIIGWLTYVGAHARRRGRFDEKVVELAFREGAKLAAQELEHFLSIRTVARKRYVWILRQAARSGRCRWIELKRAIEIQEGKRIADPVFAGLLESLLKASFLRKNEDGSYSVTDPLLAHALKTNLIR